ncbi:unnamed protein product, partial [Owenia fusiformis]
QLYPSDDVILEEQKKEVTEARLYARKLAVVSLSDKKDEEKENPVEKEKEKNDKVVYLFDYCLFICLFVEAVRSQCYSNHIKTSTRTLYMYETDFLVYHFTTCFRLPRVAWFSVIMQILSYHLR